MNEYVLNCIQESCREKDLEMSAIIPDIIESCCDAYDAIVSIKNKSVVPVITITKSRNDLLFAMKFGTTRQIPPDFGDTIESIVFDTEVDGEIFDVPSRKFAEATEIAKCYDFINNGKGITIVITYENAFIK